MSAQIGNSQCERTVFITITSINFVSGCDYDESSGIDAVLEVSDLQDNFLYESEFENLSEVMGPQNNFVIDLNVHPNSCGNNDLIFELGTFPINQLTYETEVRIFNRNNIFSCAPYFFLTDSNHGNDNYTFDLIADSGLIESGSCMSFNYTLSYILEGAVETLINPRICFDDFITVNGTEYNTSNPSGSELIESASDQECDSLFVVDVKFFPTKNIEFLSPTIYCPDEPMIVQVADNFETYEWSNGETSATFIAQGTGLYAVTATDANGCAFESSIEIEELNAVDFEIAGDFEFCEGSEAILSVSGEYESIEWSNSETTEFISVNEPGLYTVIVTNNLGCTFEASQQVIQFDQLILNIDSLTCFEDQVGVIDSVYQDENGCDVLLSINIQQEHSFECDIDFTHSVLRASCDNALDGAIRIKILNDLLPVEIDLFTVDGSFLRSEVILNSFEEIEFSNFSVGDYYAQLTNVNGSSTQIDFSIKSMTALDYSLEYPAFVSLNESQVISINVDENTLQSIAVYQDGMVLCEDCSRFIDFSIEQVSKFRLVITDENGCVYEEFFQIDLNIEGDVYVPNIISLSASNENSIFKAYGNDIESVTQFEIYNRWGNLIYSDNTGSNETQWDGNLVSGNSQLGVYIYKIEVVFSDDTKKQFSGSLTVIN